MTLVMADTGYLTSLQDILVRHSRRPVERRALATRLIDLLSATGHRVRGVHAAAWSELTSDPEPHAANARAFEAIANAGDPLEAARQAPALIRSRVFGRLEGWWQRQRQRDDFRGLPTRLQDVAWSELPARRRTFSPKDDIRSAVLALTQYERSFVRRGQPHKGDQDTALWGLADVFIELTGSDAYPTALPHEPKSRFIQFAHTALAPYFPATEVSVAALAGRWQRAKQHERTAFGS